MEQLLSIFDAKYSEFAKNLLEAVPELSTAIHASLALPVGERYQRFKDEVLPGISPKNMAAVRTILPGVTLTDDIWTSLGSEAQNAIGQFVSVLGVCAGGYSEDNEKSSTWTDEFLNQWKDSMSSIDFEGMAKKFAEAFAATAAAATTASEGGATEGGGSTPFFPEHLLKGQLAKLAEEIMREIKPEEFGFSKETMEETEKNPGKAFEILTDIFTKKPEVLKRVMQRVMKRLQDKIRRGDFKPQEIAKEVEELLKNMTENSAFKDLLDSLKGSFGFGDAEEAADLFKAAGRDGDARRNIVRERLKKEAARREAAKGKKR